MRKSLYLLILFFLTFTRLYAGAFIPGSTPQPIVMFHNIYGAPEYIPEDGTGMNFGYNLTFLVFTNYCAELHFGDTRDADFSAGLGIFSFFQLQAGGGTRSGFVRAASAVPLSVIGKIADLPVPLSRLTLNTSVKYFWETNESALLAGLGFWY